jgi:hypothetical protein
MDRKSTLLGACDAVANASRLVEDAAILFAAGCVFRVIVTGDFAKA